MVRLAYVVSPHGFGHAARACAVMAELVRRSPGIHFDVVTSVPEWFFVQSLPGGMTYHPFDVDVGLVQSSPLHEDLEETIARLDDFWRDGTRVARLAELLDALGSRLVVADIAPLALASAAALSLPAILIENFTWDWIYCNYTEAPLQLCRHGRRLEEVFAGADLRIQAEPLCNRVSNAVRVPPVARPSLRSRDETRQALGIPLDAPMVVVSMGGVPWNYSEFSAIDLGHHGPWVVVPGGSEAAPRRRGRLVLLPFHSEFYHPDLAGAADVVVSKLGYSTVAEAYSSGAAIVYVERPRFPESPVLARWVEANMAAVGVSETALEHGGWLEAANALLTRRRHTAARANGAGRAAEVILEHCGSLSE